MWPIVVRTINTTDVNIIYNMHKKTRPNKMTYQRNFPVRIIGKNLLALDNINLVRSLLCLIFPIKKNSSIVF